jgi:hypothetical protein
MVGLTGYFDAAGHPDGKHALVVGGYVSSVPAWLRFDRDWRRALSKVGIQTFHMADLMACEDEFKSWHGREVERDALLLKLARITKKYVRRSFSATVPLDAWKSVNQAYQLKENHCTPYGLGGFYVIDRTMRWLARREKEWGAAFIFEDGDKHKGDLIWIMDQFVRQNRKRHAGAAPIFRPKSLSPLQAADFVLWEQRRLFAERLAMPDSPPEVRRTMRELMGIKKTWGVFTEADLVKFCVDFEIPKRGASGRWSPISSARKARDAGPR